MPYIEYSLFKGYVAKNLCVKKNEKGNCCQGKCFVKKQIKTIDENSSENSNTNNTSKRTQNNEANEFLCSQIFIFKPVEIELLLLLITEFVKLKGFVSIIFIPPKLKCEFFLNSK